MKRYLTLIILCLYIMICFGCVDNENLNSNQTSVEASEEVEDINETTTKKEKNQTVIEVSEPLSLEEYFKNNSMPIVIDDNNSFGNLEYLDSELDQNEIFLTGEIHNIASNSDLEMSFLKYFKEKTDFKYYLCEISYSMSYFLNQYLATGDEAILDQVFELIRDTSTQEMYDHWVEVYEYNSQLEEDRKIQVVGVDIEQNIVMTYRFLTSIIPDKDVPEDIKASVDLIKESHELLKMSFQNKYLAVKNTKVLIEDLSNHYGLYEEFFEDDLIYYELVLQSAMQYEKEKSKQGDYLEWSKTRDLEIYDNFVKIDDILPDDKYYGQWGLQHVFQNKENNITWFATYLDSEESKYHGKVLSIAYNYSDCKMLLAKDSEATSIDAVYPFLVDVQDLYVDKYTLYKLNNFDTDRPPIPMTFNIRDESLVVDVNEFFQYILLVKDSEASER